jgi:hypothetical protein
MIAGKFKFVGNKVFESELVELQEAFASVQFGVFLNQQKRRFSGIRRSSRRGLLVGALLNMRLRIDGNKNHALPHIHVDYGKHYRTACYAIGTGARLAGGLSRKYDRLVKKWIAKNKAKLLDAWQLIQDSRNTDVIVSELLEAR